MILIHIPSSASKRLGPGVPRRDQFKLAMVLLFISAKSCAAPPYESDESPSRFVWANTMLIDFGAPDTGSCLQMCLSCVFFFSESSLDLKRLRASQSDREHALSPKPNPAIPAREGPLEAYGRDAGRAYTNLWDPVGSLRSGWVLFLRH